MSYKITSLNPFDRGFFGTTLLAKRPLPKNFKPSKLEFDSADDFNKYLNKQILSAFNAKARSLEQTPGPKIEEHRTGHTLFSMF